MTVMQSFMFIVLSVVVLFVAHYFFYLSATDILGISSAFYQNIFFIVISFLAVSFLLSILLSRVWENSFTRSFYFASSWWLGLLTNLILAIIIYWLIGAGKSLIVPFLFLLVLAFSLYATFNAFKPRIKNISVKIPGLPENWKNKKIVQLSDIHLGIIHRDKFLKNVVEKVNSVNPEMVVITGDLFDGLDGDLNLIIGPVNDLKTDKIFFITGNHEVYLGTDKAYAALAPTKVKVMRDEVIDVEGLKLIGLNYLASPVLIHSLKKDFSGRPNILLYHAPVGIEEFKNAGVNLQLSGHTHAGQIFPFDLVTKVFYKGFDYGLRRIGAYTIYTTSGVGTWGPAMRSAKSPEIVVINLEP